MDHDLTKSPDAELLRLSRSHEEPFAIFYGRYEKLVAGWLMRRTGQPDLVADLTAEVFAAAYLAAPRFRDGPEPAAAWLLGIARNKLLRSLRRERTENAARRRLAVERIEVSDASLAAIEDLRDRGVMELLADLPEEQRDAVRARIIDELDYAQLAARAHISPALARKRVSRGLATLRARLNPQGDTR